jgi:hypothetical protein
MRQCLIFEPYLKNEFSKLFRTKLIQNDYVKISFYQLSYQDMIQTLILRFKSVVFLIWSLDMVFQ